VHPNLNIGHERKPIYLSGKLPVAQLGNKLHASYGHRRYIIVFTAVHHWAVSR
jgi:hypothetical protein